MTLLSPQQRAEQLAYRHQEQQQQQRPHPIAAWRLREQQLLYTVLVEHTFTTRYFLLYITDNATLLSFFFSLRDSQRRSAEVQFRRRYLELQSQRSSP